MKRENDFYGLGAYHSSSVDENVMFRVNTHRKYRRLCKKRNRKNNDIEFDAKRGARYENLYFHSEKCSGSVERNGEFIVEYLITTENNICLNNHKIFKQYMFPTDAYLELVFVSCKSYFIIHELVFKNITIVNPLTGDHKLRCRVKVVFRKSGNGLRFEVRSSSSTNYIVDNYKVHMRGFLHSTQKQGNHVAKYSQQLERDDAKHFDVEQFYCKDSSIYLGEFYRALKSLTFGQQFSIARIAADKTENRFLLNPSVVSAALANAMSYAPYRLETSYKIGGDLFLPYKIDELFVFGSLLGSSYTSLAEIKNATKNWIEVYLEIVDEHNNAIVIFNSLRLQRVKPYGNELPNKEHKVDSSQHLTKQIKTNTTKRVRNALVDVGATTSDIAVIGMSCRFPKSKNIAEFWDALENGADCITEVPENRWREFKHWYHPDPKHQHTSYSKWGGFIDDVDKFDPLFFNISPSDAEMMDPQQRVFLQEAWKTIESAGYSPQALNNKTCGVFVGCSTGDYDRLLAMKGADTNAQSFMGTSSAILAARISYFLNLKGPSLSIDTACSSSLTAIHLACMSIRNGESDLAIAGGVSVFSTPLSHILTSRVGMQSLDGRCFSFDKSANGTVFSEGCGAVLLKPLSQAECDRDNIIGVIKASGVNQDGKTNGITAPSAKSQQRLIRSVYKQYKINPSEISYVEAHGTATPLGDPIEVQALTSAFQEFCDRNQYCAIGSVKSNIGHGSYAAGVAGVIKLLLCLKNKRLVPTVHFKSPNNAIEFSQTPFYVSTQNEYWPEPSCGKRIAAVSSFGFSGTNAHLVLEEYKTQVDAEDCHQNSHYSETQATPVIVPLSAKNMERLKVLARNLSTHLKQSIPIGVYMTGEEGKPASDKVGNKYKQLSGKSALSAIAYTLQVGRDNMEERVAFVVDSITDLIHKLEAFSVNKDLIEGCYQGNIKHGSEIIADFNADKDIQQLLTAWIQKGMVSKYLNFWVKGLDIDWGLLYNDDKPYRVMLPAYPFIENRYWVTADIKHQNDAHSSSMQLELFEHIWHPQNLDTASSTEINTIVCFLSDVEKQNEFEKSVQSVSNETRVIYIAQGRNNLKRTNNNYEVAVDKQNTYRESLCSILQNIKDEIGAIDAVLYLWPLEDHRLTQDISKVTSLLSLMSSSELVTQRLYFAGSIETELDAYTFNRWSTLIQSAGNSIPNTYLSVLVHERSKSADHWEIKSWTLRIWEEMQQNHSGYILFRDNRRFSRLVRRIPDQQLDCTPIKCGGSYIIICERDELASLLAEYLELSGAAKLIFIIQSQFYNNIKQNIQQLEHRDVEVEYIPLGSLQPLDLDKGLDTAKQACQEINGIFYLGPNKNDTPIKHATKNSGLVPLLANNANMVQEDVDFFCHFLFDGEPSNQVFQENSISEDYSIVNITKLSGDSSKQEKQVKSIVVDYTSEGLLRFNKPFSENQEAYSNVTLLEKIFHQVFMPENSQDSTDSITIMALVTLQNELSNNTNYVEKSRPGYERAVLETERNGRIELETKEISDRVKNELRSAIHSQLKIDQALVEDDTYFSEFGFDSINLTALAQHLSQRFGIEILPTVLFGNSTLEKLTAYLISHCLEAMIHFCTKSNYAIGKSVPFKREVTAINSVQNKNCRDASRNVGTSNDCFQHAKIPPISNSMPDRIAVIGMSGKFPMADSLDAFWYNLRSGKDCISCVPKDRWSNKQTETEFSNNKGAVTDVWGGFLDGIAEFDPKFFGISDREAELMDPQQRLIMTYVYRAVEDAGYSPKSLAGKNIAVFIATNRSGYGDIIEKSGASSEAYAATGTQPSVGPNRISYFLDLKGPSEPIETACASSLVAIRRGIMALKDGCEMAIVGGVNVLLSPKEYVAYKKAGMLSPNGRCKTFSSNADGFVRSEAVGILVLKKQAKAENDSDNIYGLICGSGENHGGRSHSLTTPNLEAQAQLLEKTYKEANINPNTVTYIEAHGTGTPLGDSIEIEALKSAFNQLCSKTREKRVIKENDITPENPYCGLGSVKTNIGHTELASGVVGIIKVLLQMKHRILVKNINTSPPSPYLQLQGSPFYIVQHEQKWEALHEEDGASIPRRAGVSAFGMGGVNAHVLLEEYISKHEAASEVKSNQLVVFSARTKRQLKNVVKQMLAYVQAQHEVLLRNLAYTLQTGRDALEYRLAMVVPDRESLRLGLEQFLNQDDMKLSSTLPPVANMYIGQCERGVDVDSEIINNWIQQNNLKKLGQCWVKGGKIPWGTLHKGKVMRRISLPTYPFDSKPYWVTGVNPLAETITPAAEHEANEVVKKAAEKITYHSMPGSTLFHSWANYN